MSSQFFEYIDFIKFLSRYFLLNITKKFQRNFGPWAHRDLEIKLDLYIRFKNPTYAEKMKLLQQQTGYLSENC